MGCDGSYHVDTTFSYDFNPRTPVGCDTLLHNNAAAIGIFQSTHPSGVRPADALHFGLGEDISIHAPQWGATKQGGGKGFLGQISIHAPQWGATLSRPSRRVASVHFNPRTPVGCDWQPRHSLPGRWYFNPRTPVGCDHRRRAATDRPDDFNPRTPVGCDLGVIGGCLHGVCFCSIGS